MLFCYSVIHTILVKPWWAPLCCQQNPRDITILNATTFAEALERRRTHRSFTEASVSQSHLNRLLWAAQGKTTDDGKRTAPSAHTLHPLRLFVCAGQIGGMDPGVYAVDAASGALTLHIGSDVRGALEREVLEEQPWVGSAAGIITICADLVAPSHAFANQSPYGDRGLRYVHIEAGAAAQNIYLQAAAEGLGCVLVGGFKDEATGNVLNLSPPLAPVLHMCFGWPAEG